MSKRIKEMLVAELQQRLGETDEMLVVDSSRLDAINDNRFRLALREKGICILTVKNSMAMRALHSCDVTALDPILEGPSSLVFGGEDIVALSKEVASWVKDFGGELLEVKGGVLEGTTLTAGDVVELSKSPSREELIGQIVGLLLSPGASIAGSLLGPGGLVAGAIEAMGDGDAEAESATDEPESATDEPESADEPADEPAQAESSEEPVEPEDTDTEGGQESDSEESGS